MRDCSGLLHQSCDNWFGDDAHFFSAEEIEDLVQDILLSIHAVRATFDPKRALMPWVSTIAHSRITEGARRYYRGKSHEFGEHRD